MASFSTLCFFEVGACFGEGYVPIFRIGAANKTGLEIGTALGNAIKQKFPNIEKRIDGYLASFTDQDEFNRKFLNRIEAIRQNINMRYADEVNAVAATFDLSRRDRLGDGHLSRNEFWLYQLIPDVGRKTNCSGFGVFGSHAASGKPIVGRNMDWNTTGDLRSITAITVYKHEKTVMVNIGYAGYVAVITGFNDKGLFLAHLDSPKRHRYPNQLDDRHSAVFDMRQTLEQNGDITSARKTLMNKYPFSHNVLIADPKEVAVLEQPEGESGRLRSDRSPLRNELAWDRPGRIAVVNCFALYGYSNTISSHDYRRWYRFRNMANRIGNNHPAHPSDIVKMMTDRKGMIFHAATAQSMVFTPHDKRLFLYTVPVSGIHDEKPVLEEIKNLLPKSASEQSSGKRLLPSLFLLMLIGVFMYYKWEVRFKEKLTGNKSTNEPNGF